ncbi:hypothetical protein K466DRAFT_391046 [Polyporus arcularius HHB13444]|uniref:Uncharacterized protein n=1 Tax=Polyporus arcularius HHB13444 TaxID=1314778 RepID=A0A5C3NW07_9APHY|nr:hypothetical protein K466DRAFT_391046 [Polyporus arcularius HHB13444]
MEDKRDSDSRRSLSSNTSWSYHRLSPASTMLFTAKFTALVFAVVAATFCQVTAKPAPVEASSNSKDALTHGVDTIDANVTRVGQPIDSAVPTPDAAYHFQYSTRLVGNAFCSEAPSDLGHVTVPNENHCTPITFGANVQCIRFTPGSLTVDPRRVRVCTRNCFNCMRLSEYYSLPDNFYYTPSIQSMYVSN